MPPVQRRSDDHGRDRHQLDQDVERRAARILQRVADRVGHNTRLVSIRVLTTMMALLDVLLGVVRRTTRVGLEESHGDTRDDGTDQDPRKEQRMRQTGQNDDPKCHEPRSLHALQGSRSRDRDGGLVVSRLLARIQDGQLGLSEITTLGTLQNHEGIANGTRLSELLRDEGAHRSPRRTDSVDGHSGEHERNRTTDQQAREGPGGSHQRIELHLTTVVDHHHDRRESGRSDGEALADCSRSVADSVQVIGMTANLFRKPCHFSDAPTVVTDGTIRIDGELHVERAQHRHCGNGDPVETTQVVGSDDGSGEDEGGHERRRHPDRQHLGEEHRRTRLGSLREVLDVLVLSGALALGVVPDAPAGANADQDCEPQAEEADFTSGTDEGRVPDDQPGQTQRKGRESNSSGVDTTIEGLLRTIVTVLHLHTERGSDRDEDAQRRERHRQLDQLVDELLPASEDHYESKSHRSEHASDVGLEKVGAHSGDVSNVVSHAVRDDPSVQGVILGETCDHLAGVVSANISGLRIDATSNPGEQGYHGRTQRDASEGVEENVQLPHLRPDQ